jgi:type I restriction enzyme S subunit
MNRYQSYKPSGVEWVGEIPNNWEETRLKYVGNLYGGLTGKSGEDFKQEDNPNNKPYIPYTNIFRNTYISKNHVDYVVLQDGENQNKVKKYDLFFLMSSETYQDLGKPCILIDDIEELYLNSFCKGFRVYRNDISPLFLNYQLLGSIHKELISIEGRGFTRINLRQDRLNETPIFIPPQQEQSQIVQFLDEKTELINKLISTKERKITLLKEQRTSLINQVVTKGLNPNVKMKDSGVEWIGEIPEFWVTKKMKYLVQICNGSDFKDFTLEEGGFPVYGSGGEFSRSSKFIYDKISVLLGRKGSVDKPKIVNEPFWCSDTTYYTKIKVEVNPYFFFFLVQQIDFRRFIYGSTIPSMTKSVYDEMEFPYPSINEQNEIVEFLDSKTKEIDDLVQLEQKKIDLLKEYRQSLISEVVTGKIKVTTD